ncbi:MAG: hypothetical protein U0324_10270 [Polyangiales bacterium]
MRKPGFATSLLASGRHPGEVADVARVDAMRQLSPARRAELGQYMTPAAVASFMASLLRTDAAEVRLLDAGAGVGALTAAAVEAFAGRPARPTSITVDAWEVDPTLARYLRETLTACEEHGAAAGLRVEARVHVENFIASGVGALDGGLFATQRGAFNAAILNPP